MPTAVAPDWRLRRRWRPCGCAAAWLVTVLLAGLLSGPLAAQEQFFTQSGGRGLQNAKLNARMSRAEVNVTDLQAEMATVRPHAKTDIAGCTNTGDKLRWDGTRWTCDEETDPTVQGWAKEALPSCGAGQIIGINGGRFGCQNPGYVSTELDPTVQAFAKTALPNCGAGQVLGVGVSGGLSCVNDNAGLTRETDPNVHAFARTENAVPNCSTSEVLTMVGGRLQCRVDMLGVTQETDPMVQPFARNDIAGYALTECAAGEVLISEKRGASVVLSCKSGGTVLANAFALDDLSDVTTAGQVSGSILSFNGSQWVAGSENDPTVKPFAKTVLPVCATGQVLTATSGGALACTNDAGGATQPLRLRDLGDVNVASIAANNLLVWKGTEWQPLAMPTCAAGKVLSWNGSAFSCVDDAGGTANPFALNDLLDVDVTAATVGQVLRKGAAGWEGSDDRVASLATTSSNWCRSNGTQVVCNITAPTTCASNEVLTWNGTAMSCVNASAGLGLGTIATQNANNVDITGGLIDGTVIGSRTPAAGTFTSLGATTASVTGNLTAGTLTAGGALVTGDLSVRGNLRVSGTQSIDGVTFANGGIQTPGGITSNRLDAVDVSVTHNLTVGGTVTAGRFVGDGSALTGVVATGVAAQGVSGSLQFKNGSGGLAGDNVLVYDDATGSVQSTHVVATQTVKVAASTAGCTAADYGSLRMVDMGSGDLRLQFCKP